VKSLSVTIKKVAPLLVAAFFIGMMIVNYSQRNISGIILISGDTMGTTYSVKIADPVEKPIEKRLKIDLDRELDIINHLMSSYKPSSEINTANNHTSKNPFQISEHLYNVLSISKDVYDYSEHAFDITLAPLIELWGFSSYHEQNIPDHKLIIEQLKNTGFDLISLQKQSGCLHPLESNDDCFYLSKMNKAVNINVSGVAKGYAVDHIADILSQQGYKNFLVEIGGEVYASGYKKDDVMWKLGVETPNSPSRSIEAVIALKNKAIATSGDYRNYFERNGVRYSHTLDPKNGYPITHKLASVSVIHDNAAYADAWATALNVLGLDKALEVATKHQLAAYFIEYSGDGFVVKYTPEFEFHISPKSSSIH
jgi:FAD:protein FMN transferase